MILIVVEPTKAILDFSGMRPEITCLSRSVKTLSTLSTARAADQAVRIADR